LYPKYSRVTGLPRKSGLPVSKVAWYDVKGKGWLRDIIVLLHPPYTLWCLAYVPIGAALAPRRDWGVLGWTVLAFFLAMGIGGHCLDELNGRPLRTRFPSWGLWLAAVLSIAGAIAIGVFIGVKETIWVIPCIVFGGFIVFAYNLEWGRGFFHHDFWFAFAWGAFPAITAHIAQVHTITSELVMIAYFALMYSWAQRVLSLQARFWRRKVEILDGAYYYVGDYPGVTGPVGWGQSYNLTKEVIIGPAETALKLMNWAVVAAAIGLLSLHL